MVMVIFNAIGDGFLTLEIKSFNGNSTIVPRFFLKVHIFETKKPKMLRESADILLYDFGVSMRCNISDEKPKLSILFYAFS